MASVEIPKWLKHLPLAPEFRPTETEFADPIAYISKIEKEASAFGICKVIPPLPKPSKRYVLSNLKRSLSRSRELGLDVNIINSGVSLSEGRTIGSEASAVFTTRQQQLGQTGKRGRDPGCMPQSVGQKQVWHSGEVYTLEQFESKSKAFSRNVLGGIKEVTPQVIETLFWKANSQKPIYVEYANDVPGSGFGEPNKLLHYFHGRKRRRRSCYMQQDLNTGEDPVSGLGIEVSGQNSYSFLEQSKKCAEQPTSKSNETSSSTKQSVSYANGDLEGSAGWKLSNSPWNLQVIARSAGSLTRFLLRDIPGVTSPMVYIGMLFSWFAWHVEDHELHSLNYLHMGSPKTWYAVPGDYAFAFEEIIRTQAYGGDIDHLAALKLIGEKTTLLSPELVVASGIPCCRLVQNPGEFVVTFPRAYHVGFSHGFNCGEAANFGTPQWLTLAKDAAVRRAAMGHLPMLSHQQLLYLLTMSFIPRIPRSLLPGVRSSRLKDRIKEERELLVKKAFIEDVMKENKLLNTLSERLSTFRAVLWHPDLLPSVAKGSIPQTGAVLYSVLDKDNQLDLTATKNSNQDGHVHQLTSDVETVNDLCNSDDLSCDFQGDSGALVCVACGVLGYPLMSVIQPSMKAATQLIPGDHLRTTSPAEIRQKPKSSYLQDLTMSDISGTDSDETLDTHGFLRPRFFCLEHAVRIEELLRSKGGAKTLVICHSDYKKLKVNASTVAEEIRTAFNFEEVQLDTASKEELSLIDVAIDGEQFKDFQEDWTSRLGMNLSHSIKVRTSYPSKKIGVLGPDYLRCVFPPVSMISSIKWFSRKSRTRRESNYLKHSKSCGVNHSNKDETIDESRSNLKRREQVLLQYSRRKYRAKSRYSGEKSNSRSSVDCLQEATNANSGTIDACEQGPSFSDDPLILGETRLEEESNQVNQYLVADKCHCLPAASLLAIDNNNNDQVDIDVMEEANDLMTRSSSEEPSNNHQDLSISDITDSAYHTTNNAEITGSSVIGKTCSELEVYGPTNCNMSETKCANETHKNNITTCMESTTTVELNMRTLPKERRKGMKQTIANAKVMSLNRSKRAREVEEAEAHDDFVRSPCEGLRPRKKKEDPTTCKSSSNTTSEQKLASKMVVEKSSRRSIPRTEVMDSKSGPSYKCNLEGCRMCFKTRAELSLHKRNKCHYEECRKKFRSHKYVVLHQRVHDDKRPLKCTWKGCGMTFKWAWARTEHMRLHTGERPYKCKIEGCGLTFRFVSDFSRHRRKMGHYLNIL